MDPYAAPGVDEAAVAEPRDLAPVKTIILAWERLRTVYNLVVAAPGIWVLIEAISRKLARLDIALIEAAMFAFAANVCFFAGPLVEIYAAALFGRAPSKVLRYTLFGAGSIASVGLILLIGVVITIDLGLH